MTAPRKPINTNELVFEINNKSLAAEDGANGEESLVDTLIHTVKQRIAAEQSDDQMPSVPLSKLTSLATRKEKFTLVLGWLFAFLTGISLPCFVWTIGDMFDAFNATEYSREESRDRVRVIFAAMIALCIFLVTTATLQYATLSGASAKITARIKLKYLESILRQESSWFDLNNQKELSIRLSKECAAI